MKTNLIAYLFLSLILFLSQHQIKSTRVETINSTSQESFCLKIDDLLKIKDLKQVERIYINGSEKGINSLQCLEKLNGKSAFKFIEMKLDGNQIDDLSYLADFISYQNQLTHFYGQLGQNKITNINNLIQSFSLLSLLESYTIDLGNNQISSINQEINFHSQNIHEIDLIISNNQISQIEENFLKKTGNLKKLVLNLQNNLINSVAFLQGLKDNEQMESLNINLQKNEIKDIDDIDAYLSNITQLLRFTLNLNQNQIQSILSLQNLIINLPMLQRFNIEVKEQNESDLNCIANSEYLDPQKYFNFQEKSCVISDITQTIEGCYNYKANGYCLTCQNQFYFQNGKCVQNCEDGTYLQKYEIKQMGTQYICIDSCLQNYYLDEENSKCNTCEVQNCMKCSEKDKCDECMVLFSLHNDQHQCIFCSANCKTCNSIIECKECDGDYKIFTKVVGKQIEYTCISECPPTHIVVDNKYCELKDCGEGKYLQDDGSCKDCIKNCSKCLGPKNDQCVQCNLNYEFSDERECVKIYKGPSGTLIAILIILIVLFTVLIGFVLWRYFRYRQTLAKKKQFSTQFIDEYEESEQVSFKSNDSK